MSVSVGKALRYLYPNARVGVAAGANPDYIVAADENGDEQIVLWKLPLPQPSEAQIIAAAAASEAAEAQRQTEATTLRQHVLTLAQSAVGIRIDQLTAAQVRALFAILLRKEGALKADGTVRPLAEWVKE